MNKDSPLVYIVMPCYNWEKYLLEQLMSIYHQNYTNWYLIFVNDWSTDNSENILRDFISHYNLYSKVKVINKDNGGVNSAINVWLSEVKKVCNLKSPDCLVAYCDSDDIWTREKLSVQVDYMMHNNYGLSYHDVVIIDENSEILQSSMLKSVYYKWESFFAVACFWVHFYSTEMMFRPEYIDLILPLPEWFTIGQDLWTWLVLSIINVRIWFIDKTLAYYRKQKNSLSNKSKWIENAKQRVKYFTLVWERVKKDVTYEYNYYSDRWINWISCWYSLVRVYLLMFLKYPKVFFVYIRVFFYEKILVKFMK